jgi:uncharacterized membrane protein SpoIIM required for sporulation
VIINLQAFIDQEQRVWTELEGVLDRLERQPGSRLELAEIRHFHALYQRASADLARLKTFAAERELNRYLEALVARAYSEIHKTTGGGARLHPLRWLLATFPQTFRRHIAAFWLALAVTLGGAGFGGGALLFDPAAKEIIMPFEHLRGSPAERVAQVEHAGDAVNRGHQASMTGFYISHNTRVSIQSFALGMTWGVGTLVMLFYNGVILGAVFADYIAAGQARFVFGWLLPHGSFEIPAILVAGQAGFVLAGALIGWGRRLPLRRRLAAIGPDLVTLILGFSLMLVWAGIIEAFFSQYHEPVVPYRIKIAFGCVELGLLAFYLAGMGRGKGGAPARAER